MTANPSIDPGRMFEEQLLAQAPPDLLPVLLQTFHQRLAVGGGRRGVRRWLRFEDSNSAAFH
jgi:hypothetical protein